MYCLRLGGRKRTDAARYIRYDLTGDTADDWEVTGVLYNSIFYHSLSSFRAAIHKPGFIINGANTDGDWASTDRSGPPLLEDERFPPIPVAPAGSRYKIDAEKMYVEWMDFSFYIAFSRDTGVRMFDLRYRGERIVYELGIMEAMAVYGMSLLIAEGRQTLPPQPPLAP